MNMNIIMFGYGCIWVYIDTLGYTDTNTQANNTKRDRNGLAGYDSRPCITGQFPFKRCFCESRYQG